MAHLTRVRAHWPRGHIVTAAELSAIDDKTTKAVNGDGGGTYTPSSPLEIGGAGVGVVGPWTLESSAAYEAAGDDLSHVELGGDATETGPVFAAGHDARERDILRMLNASFVEDRSALSVNTFHGSIKAYRPGARFYTPIDVHHGATLDAVTFTLRVVDAHAGGVPHHLPRFRVVRADAAGQVEALRELDATTDREGFREWSPVPASGAAWQDTSLPQTFEYVCSVRNVIDTTRFFYLAEIIEEQGTNAWSAANNGNIYVSAIAHHTQIEALTHRG